MFSNAFNYFMLAFMMKWLTVIFIKIPTFILDRIWILNWIKLWSAGGACWIRATYPLKSTKTAMCFNDFSYCISLSICPHKLLNIAVKLKSRLVSGDMPQWYHRLYFSSNTICAICIVRNCSLYVVISFIVIVPNWLGILWV